MDGLAGILTVLVTLLCFVGGCFIGGFLARRQAGHTAWTMEDEIRWWVKLVKGR